MGQIWTSKHYKQYTDVSYQYSIILHTYITSYYIPECPTLTTEICACVIYYLLQWNYVSQADQDKRMKTRIQSHLLDSVFTLIIIFNCQDFLAMGGNTLARVYKEYPFSLAAISKHNTPQVLGVNIEIFQPKDFIYHTSLAHHSVSFSLYVLGRVKTI